MPDYILRLKMYRRSVRASFFLVLFLVFVGGVVRSTGAGMGCPDWPKCFGSWVPPTDISQVPLSYYSHPLSSKDGVLIFNPIKTWTEYVNRLIGVFIGFSLFIQMVFAFRSGTNATSKMYSLAAFILVMFEGWLGAKVVATDLKPVVITIHLVGALLIAYSLLAALHYAKTEKPFLSFDKLVKLPAIVFVLLTIQFFLGANVRGQVDVLFKKFNYAMRHEYIAELNWAFYVHRSFSILVVGVLVYQLYQLGNKLPVAQYFNLLLPIISSFLLILSGAFLNYLSFPAYVQPFHLTLGFGIVCSQFWILLQAMTHEKVGYVVA